jgi:endonuclease YncB( thermonuclease family)
MKPFLEGVIRRFAFPILLLLISLTLATTALSNDLIAARVISVTDGDNLTVIGSDNKQVLIRLHGLDCPELAQSFGENAKEFTSNLCFGKIIMYRMIGIDRFDRTIAAVFLDDGKELNLEILKAGLAWHYERYAKRQDYADAEEEARKAGIGLWADAKPTPPWEWRKDKRKKSQ